MKRVKLFPLSIRRRLIWSYAAVALLTALVLGGVLLSALRLFYQEREVDYLRRSAGYIETALSQSMAEGAAVETLQEQAASLAYVTGTEVQLINTEGLIIADSGSDDAFQWQLLIQERIADTLRGLDPPVPPELSAPGEQPVPPEPPVPLEPPDSSGFTEVPIPTAIPPTIALEPGEGDGGFSLIFPPVLELGEDDRDVRLIFPPVDEVYAVHPGRGGSTLEFEYLSDLSVTRPVLDETTGDTFGILIVSGGPGYSQGILNGVALAWMGAGAVAVGLAALVGLLVSFRMSRPLVGLTGVTAKMAEGDLSVRADAGRKDEFGTLAISFNEMADRLQTFILTLQRFVADAAHELNTPLTALRNSLDLALEEGDPTKQALLLKDGRSQVQRLEDLAGGLLNLSRLESDEQREQRLLDLVQMVLKTSERYASQAEQAGLAFRLDIPANGNGSVIVQGDETQLRSALGNLLDNAIKFTPEGGTIHLGVSAEEGWANLWIEDNGIGIPEKDLPLLFNRFHRGRNAAGYPGSGLGLAIVRAVVLRHGGEVLARNTGQGMRFTIRLPQISTGSR